jgi:hypothetical protein
MRTRSLSLAVFLFLAVVSAPAFAQDRAPVAPAITTPAVVSNPCDLACLTAIIAERDKQYTQRFDAQQKAVDAALAAQNKATDAAFSAAEKAVAAALAAQHEATSAAFAAANTAVAKAETANEKRLDSVNEFRAQLKDQASTLATRAEVNVQFHAMDDKVSTIEKNVNAADARGMGANNLWILILGALGVVLLAFGTFFRMGVPKEGVRYMASRRAADVPPAAD